MWAAAATAIAASINAPVRHLIWGCVGAAPSENNVRGMGAAAGVSRGRTSLRELLNPAGNVADQIYNSAYHTWQFCNGTSWLAFTGGGNCTAASGYNPSSPSDSGYFVLSSGTYTGNLGGLAGANSTCLTDLTTNTGWIGYSTATANGQLVASKVLAFMCDGVICNNLMPSTTYYFANAGSGAAGGASFTTNSSGFGPGDNANWSGSTYFGGSYTSWVDMGGSISTTLWTGIPANNATFACAGWTTTGGSGGYIAISAATNFARWNDNSSPACTNTYHLICVVNP